LGSCKPSARREPSCQHLCFGPSSTFFRRTIVPEIDSQASEEPTGNNSKEERSNSTAGDTVTDPERKAHGGAKQIPLLAKKKDQDKPQSTISEDDSSSRINQEGERSKNPNLLEEIAQQP